MPPPGPAYRARPTQGVYRNRWRRVPPVVRIQNDLDATLFTFPWTYADYFDRSVGAGTNLGTADRGGVYTPYTTTIGTAVTVSGGAGRIVPSAVPKTYHQTLNGVTGDNVLAKVLVSFSTLATGASQEMSVYARSDAGSDNYYTADFEQLTDGSCRLSIEKNTVGARTDIASPSTLGSYGAADSKWWIELSVQGTALEARAWPIDGTRPSTPTLTGTDSAYATGCIGVRARVNVSNTNAAEFRFWEGYAYLTAAGARIISVPVATASPAAAIAPSLLVTVQAPVSTETASAPVPVPVWGALAVPLATATSAAPAPALSVLVAAPLATESALAPVPTILKGRTVPVPTATATSAAVLPNLLVLAAAPVATATASAPLPTLRVTVQPPVATEAASGLVPTPLFGAVAVPLATATSGALGPTLKVTMLPAAATATAAGLVPKLVVVVNPPVATATAAGLVPVILKGQRVIGVPVATATASGLVPTLAVILKPPVALEAASAALPKPVVLISPPTATILALAAVPVIINAGGPVTILTPAPPLISQLV